MTDSAIDDVIVNTIMSDVPRETSDAPYGYTAGGRVRKRPLGSRAGGKRQKKGGRDFREDIKGTIQICGLPLVALGSYDEAYLADAAALSIHAEPIADALNSLAQHNLRIAMVLERLSQVGPYGLLLSALTPLIAQIAANHGVIKGGAFGTVSKDALIETVMGEATKHESNGTGDLNGSHARA